MDSVSSKELKPCLLLTNKSSHNKKAIMWIINRVLSEMFIDITIVFRNGSLSSNEEIVAFYNEHVKAFLKFKMNDSVMLVFHSKTIDTINRISRCEGVILSDKEINFMLKLILSDMTIALAQKTTIDEIIYRLSPEMKKLHSIEEIDSKHLMYNFMHMLATTDSLIKLVGATSFPDWLCCATERFMSKANE
jgi:hypothetical protein